jgi:hypothetical protein
MENIEVLLRKHLSHIVLIIVVLAILFYIKKDQIRQLRTDGEQQSKDGNGSLYFLGRGSEQDDVATLLHRISWSAYLRKRTERWQRVFIITFFVVLLLMVLVFYKEQYTVPKIVATSVVVFFCVYMLENFMYIHGDIYNDANLRGNAKLVASKLGLKVDFDSDPPKPKSEAVDRVNIMT